MKAFSFSQVYKKFFLLSMAENQFVSLTNIYVCIMLNYFMEK